ncbi:UNVERIFIED_ORG: hypothetical protein J2W65_002482 [Pseudomonas parafulva]|nr:hypothetical protein [Pseudomonas parafulva]
MRVPIYPFDLSPKLRFKKIARLIQSGWPGADVLSLSSAQELLAQGLGYRDFYDVQQFAKVYPSGSPTPSLTEVKDRLITAIKMYAKSNNLVISSHNIARLVETLPYEELVAFKKRGAKDVGSPARDSQSHRNHGTHSVDTESNSPAEVGVQPSGHSSRPYARKLLSRAELTALQAAVKRKNSLPDLALLWLIFSTLRLAEILSVQIDRLTCNLDGSYLIMANWRAGEPFQLSSAASEAIARHIASTGISGTDYLLFSRKGAHIPMHEAELKMTLRSWASLTDLDPDRITCANIRLSVISQMSKSVPDASLIKLLSNCSPGMLRYYKSL